MTQTIEIVQIGASELPRVEALARRIWPECFSDVLGMDRIPAMLEQIYAVAVLTADMQQHGHVFWLVRINGEDAGYLAAYAEGGRLWIRKLYLLSEVRGLGLGRRLIEVARSYFPSTDRISLNVNSGNEAAIAFYLSQGFEQEARVPVRMGPFEFEDFIMTKQISTPG